MRNSLYSLTAIATAAGVAALSLPASSAAEDELAPWQQARVTGEPESCVPLTQIRQTRIRDHQTIDFEMTGNRTYRNTLSHPCGGMSRSDAISYSTSLSRLCSTDIITVLPQPVSSGIPGARCGLGQFVPIEIPEG